MKAAWLALALAVPAFAQAPEGFRWRGVLEGFYGRPWSWEQRRRFLPWMKERRLNLFVVAPKDEPLQRGDWRRPLPPEYLRELKALAAQARQSGVELAWSLSPLGSSYSAGDVETVAAKFKSAAAVGVRKLALAFDDTEPDEAQIDFANQVLAAVATDVPGVEMTFVPALYWGGASSSEYMKKAARVLDSRFSVGWTGGGVLSRRITAAEGDRFKEALHHRLALGDNFPVQDRLRESGRLFLAPLLGREAGLAASQDAVVFNASPLPEASKLALFTAADYAYDPERYSAWVSWEKAIRSLAGPNALGQHSLEFLARESSSSWLGGPRPGGLADAALDYWTGRDKSRLRSMLREGAQVEAGLGVIPNPELRRELAPWSLKLSAQAAAALASLDLLEAFRRPDEPVSPEGLLRLARLRRESDDNRAIVSDLALDRFLNRMQLVLEGKEVPVDSRPVSALIDGCAAQNPGDCEALSSGLRGLASLPRSAGEALGPDAAPALELAPWIGLLAEAADRAEASLRAPKAFLPPGATRRWRAKLRLAPLLASKELMERFLDEAERRPARPLPAALRLYLAYLRWRRPDSFPARLDVGMRKFKATEDPSALGETFRAMIDRMDRLRSPGLGVPEEVYPWLDRVKDYGQAGLDALASADRGESWQLRRDRLRSLNGLELCVLLKLRLDELPRWTAMAPDARPATLEVIYNPLEPI